MNRLLVDCAIQQKQRWRGLFEMEQVVSLFVDCGIQQKKRLREMEQVVSLFVDCAIQ